MNIKSFLTTLLLLAVMLVLGYSKAYASGAYYSPDPANTTGTLSINCGTFEGNSNAAVYTFDSGDNSTGGWLCNDSAKNSISMPPDINKIVVLSDYHTSVGCYVDVATCESNGTYVETLTVAYASATPTPTSSPSATIDTGSRNSITSFINSVVHALLSVVPIALLASAPILVTLVAIFFLWKLARHFIGQ